MPTRRGESLGSRGREAINVFAFYSLLYTTGEQPLNALQRLESYLQSSVRPLSLARCSSLVPDHDCVLQLLEEFAHGSWRVRHENSIALVLSSNFFDGIQILRDQHQHHHILGAGSFNRGRKRFHRRSE